MILFYSEIYIRLSHWLENKFWNREQIDGLNSYQKLSLPWRKYRIGIHSKPIRTIPIHYDICIRANANHSEPIRKRFVTRLMMNAKKSIRLNPI